jgi:UDP-glucose 4-epimerase
MAILHRWGGYIGSVMVDLLLENAEAVVVLDDLSRGHRRAVDDRAKFYQGETGDRRSSKGFAVKMRSKPAFTSRRHHVGESVAKPGLYFQRTRPRESLTDVLISAGLRRFVFLRPPRFTASPWPCRLTKTIRTTDEPVRLD